MKVNEAANEIVFDNKNNMKESDLSSKQEKNVDDMQPSDSPYRILEKAFNQIELFLDEKVALFASLPRKDNSEVILANLDILITRVKDILLQVEE